MSIWHLIMKIMVYDRRPTQKKDLAALQVDFEILRKKAGIIKALSWLPNRPHSQTIVFCLI